MRGSWPWVSVMVLAAVAPAAPAQTYTLKFKSYPDAGMSVAFLTTSQETGAVKFFDAAGKLLNEVKTSNQEKVYTLTVLERGPAKETPHKFTRAYEKAGKFEGDKFRPFSYQDRTVVFERKQDKYWVGVVGEPPLDADDLKQFLNRANEDRPEMSEVVTPSGPVAVGDRWKLDLKSVAAHFKSLDFDAKESKAEAQLVKVYDQGKSRFGVVEVTMQLAIKGFSGGATFERPIPMEVRGTIDGAIDGSSTARADKFTIRAKGKSVLLREKDKITVEMDATTSGRVEASAEQKAKSPPPPAVVLTGPAGVWSEVNSKEGRFTATFPEKPRVETKKDGKSVSTSYRVLLDGGNLYYEVMYLDNPDNAKGLQFFAQRGVLQFVAENFAKFTKKKREFLLNGFPGMHLELELDNQGMKIPMWIRLYMVNGRLYQVMVAAEAKLWDKAQATRFLDSFKLHEKTTPPPEEARPPELVPLIEQVEKFNGYTRIEQPTPGRSVLKIHFRGTDPKDADLAILRPLLQKATLPVDLNLHQSSVSDAGLAHLKDLTTVSVLHLSGSKLTDAGLAHLSGMTNLKELNLSSDKVSDAGLVHLSGLTSLEMLYLSKNNLSDAGLIHLKNLTNLRDLTIYSDKVTPAGYVHLAGLTRLEKLHVGNLKIDDTCLAAMKGLTKLTELTIGGKKLTDAGMAHLKHLTGLRTLHLEGTNVTATGLAHLAALKKLERLTVTYCEAIKSDMSALSGLTELQELEIIYCGEPSAKATAHLGGLNKLKNLRFANMNDEGLAGIQGMTHLEDLSLYYTGVGDAGLEHLRKLKGLQSLSLSHTRVTGSGVKHLAGMTNLKALWLDGNKITDGALKHLAGLTNLEELFLTDNKAITDAGVQHLGGLTRLTTLYLGATALTDKGIGPLKGLKSLKRLNLTGTRVSDDAALELKRALPQARIDDASGTEVSLTKPVPPKQVIEDLSKTPAAFTLTAEQFFQEYKVNSKAATAKYQGKVIELSGEVDSVGLTFSVPMIKLKVGKDEVGVFCRTADSQPWARVVPGQRVKLKGKFPEGAGNAVLVDCVFLEVGPSLAIVLTSEQFAKEYAANPEATTKKYKGKYFRLTGEIVDKEVDSAGAAQVYLKGAGKLRVGCSFEAFEKELSRSLKVGQQVTIVGRYTLNARGDEVGLYMCLPIRKE